MTADPNGSPATRVSIFVRLKGSADREIAWREFRARYAPIIAGFARNLGAAPDDIEDIIQSVILGFFQASTMFVYDPARGRFRGYLKACTFNEVKRRLGNERRLPTVPLESMDPAAREVEEAWAGPREDQLLKEALEAAHAKYEGSNTFRAFELNVIFDKPAAEVAQELGMSLDSVYQAKTRVIHTLRKELHRLEADFG